jgi:hypothetical protein
MPSASVWGWFGAWAVAGALASFAFLTGFTIGLLVLPVAALALLVASKSPRRSTAFGLFAGAGVVCLAIWWLNRGYVPCPENGALSGVPGQASVECGGADPQPWLIASIVLVLVGAVSFLVVHRRRAALG